MAANKTTKPSARPKAKASAKGKSETAKKLTAKPKVASKAPVKAKTVPKTEKRSATATIYNKPPKASPATSIKTASKNDTNGKKSIVSTAVRKIAEKKAAATAKAKAAAASARPAVARAKLQASAKLAQPAKAPIAMGKPVTSGARTSEGHKTAGQATAKVMPGVAKTSPQTTRPAATQPAAKAEAKAQAPAIVLPLKKLPVNGKPGVPVAVKPATPALPVQRPSVAKAPPAKAPVAVAQPDPKKPARPATQRHGFRTNEYIVYPSHGVGKIVRIEEQVVAGYSLELFVIHFEPEKMTLRVPTAKLASVGMRKLSESPIVDRAMETLKGRARIKRTMWSRRAQEYEAKINSGDLVSIAEVVRDLYRAETQPEQSYSERQLFEAALDRMSREIAAIENLDDRGATQKVLDVLAKSAKSRKAIEAPEAAVAGGGAERAA
jgi:CarD family transcriptional regulator